MPNQEKDKELVETFRVFCRLRPISKAAPGSDQVSPTTASTPEELHDSGPANRGGFVRADPQGRITFRCTRTEKLREYAFTAVLPEEASQAATFASVAHPVVDAVCQGYNGAILAYGQTGSGKTHSMRGSLLPGAESATEGLTDDAGIIPRTVERIFRMLETGDAMQGSARLYCSYCQIYCEVIEDLLEPSQGRLTLRERDGEVTVAGLSQVPVRDAREILALCAQGDRHRTTACTLMNAHSSRSHAVVILRLEQGQEPASGGEAADKLSSSLFLVDLAGSERAKHVGLNHQRFEELKAINLSLSALGNCVAALASGRQHVPFRDAKLTRLLQQSLGGNARTSVLVCCRTDRDFSGESQSTLEFAARCMQVPVRAYASREVDYERLWRTAQAAVDAHEEDLMQARARIRALDDEQERALQEVVRLQEEAKVSRLQLDAERRTALLEPSGSFAATGEGCSGIHDTAPGAATGGGHLSSAQQRAAMMQHVREEMDAIRAEYQKSVGRVQDKFQRQIQTYKKSAGSANAGWTSVEYDLQKEREGHLETLAQLRAANERAHKAEVEVSGRLAIVLEELSQARERIATYEGEASTLKEDKRTAAARSLELAAHVAELEETRTSEYAVLNRKFVHKDQVEAMQRLFNDTIERLGSRVAELEEQLAERPYDGHAAAQPQDTEAARRRRKNMLSRASSSLLEGLQAGSATPRSDGASGGIPTRGQIVTPRVLAPGGSVRVFGGGGSAVPGQPFHRSMSSGDRPRTGRLQRFR